MQMLSEDDLNLKDMTDEELAQAWDLWFDLAQSTNDSDPPYTHGVFVNLTWDDVAPIPKSEISPTPPEPQPARAKRSANFSSPG